MLSSADEAGHCHAAACARLADSYPCSSNRHAAVPMNPSTRSVFPDAGIVSHLQDVSFSSGLSQLAAHALPLAAFLC